MTINYTFEGQYLSLASRSYSDKEFDYEYEPSNKTLAMAIRDFYNYYDHLDLTEEKVLENYLNGVYDEELETNQDLLDHIKDYCEDMAYEEFQEDLKESNGDTSDKISLMHW